jgi:hypothetical protein
MSALFQPQGRISALNRKKYVAAAALSNQRFRRPIADSPAPSARRAHPARAGQVCATSAHSDRKCTRIRARRNLDASGGAPATWANSAAVFRGFSSMSSSRLETGALLKAVAGGGALRITAAQKSFSNSGIKRACDCFCNFLALPEQGLPQSWNHVPRGDGGHLDC